MKKDNTVIFKGGKNGITIILDEAASFEEITRSLRSKIRRARDFFAGATTKISFKGKKLNENQILSLIEIISAETELSISFVEDLTDALESEQILPVKFESSSIRGEAASLTAENEALPVLDTYFHIGGLRSGQTINHKGSVVILGDINAGAEVKASGNIVVFGVVRGVVHAGSGGDEKAFVCAMSMQPIQLRIAGIITHYPKEVILENKNKIDPVYAFVKDEEIYISPIAN